MELGKHPRAAVAGMAPWREEGNASGRLLGRLERRDERVGLRERRAVAAAEVVRRARRHRRPARPRPGPDADAVDQVRRLAMLV